MPAGVRPALAALREHGLQLVVVSNANGTLRKHMDRIGLALDVDIVIDSCDEGVEKPDPRLFEIALTRAGARAERPSTLATCIRSTSSVRGPQEYARCFSTKPAYIPTLIAIACRRWPSSWIRSELGCFDVRSMIGVFLLRSSSQPAHCARRRLALR